MALLATLASKTCVRACFPLVRVASGCPGLRWLDQRPPAAATAAKTTQSVRLQQRQVRAQRRRTAKRQLREHHLPSQRPGKAAARKCAPRATQRRQQAPAVILVPTARGLIHAAGILVPTAAATGFTTGGLAGRRRNEWCCPQARSSRDQALRRQHAPAVSEQRGKPRSAASGSSGGNATAARNPEASRRIISPARATSGGEARGSGNDNKVVRLRQRAGRRWQVALRQRWWRAHQRRRPREWRLPKWHRRSGRRSGDEAERPATRASNFGATAATGVQQRSSLMRQVVAHASTG